ncbi:MAG: hypothetical protein WKF73_17060 [Nocardioidaceae bacterium]
MNVVQEPTRRLDVTTFVARISEHLRDLSPDEQSELLDGLEADLTERLQELGESVPVDVALGSPGDYAAELRAAAGLSPRRRGRGSGASRSTGTATRWKVASERWASSGYGAAVWEFLVVLRPAWWVVRGWIAVQTVDLLVGSHSGLSWLPGVVSGDHWLWAVLLLLAVVGSVQLGRRRLWPQTVTMTWPRRLLTAANVFAVLMLVPVMSDLSNNVNAERFYNYGYVSRTPGRAGDAGLAETFSRGVHNVYAYDAQGEPLLGVQLFDQDGRPIELRRAHRDDRTWAVSYPWGWQAADDDGQANVFPQPVREQRFRQRKSDAFAEIDAPVIQTPPFVQAPPAPRLPAGSVESFQRLLASDDPTEPGGG